MGLIAILILSFNMAEELLVVGSTRAERYQSLLPQIRALIEGEKNVIANLANILAALRYGMNFFWVGIYFTEGEELVLGPFQGPPACTRIPKGKGVCGAAWQQQRTIIVPDVERFPGHIACSKHTKSEIVVPIFKQGKVWGVLDVDSDEPAYFSEIDQRYLEEVAQLIATLT